MCEVTVICCWNDEKQYNDFVNTLKAQTCHHELIGIDNRGNKSFTSCAAAYNSVIDDVKTKYVIYSHQDILLQDSDCLSKFAAYLERTERDDILGVAGVRFSEDKEVFSDVRDIEASTGQIKRAGTQGIPDGMMECSTVDECFFGGHTEHFKTFHFNEDICNGWHLYAVEACLQTQANNTRTGKVYICDVSMLHNSVGGTDYAFYWQFFRLCRHYAKHFPRIRTTCAKGRTNIIGALYRLVREDVNILERRIGIKK